MMTEDEIACCLGAPKEPEAPAKSDESLLAQGMLILASFAAGAGFTWFAMTVKRTASAVRETAGRLPAGRK